jgi:hypothetical protein
MIRSAPEHDPEKWVPLFPKDHTQATKGRRTAPKTQKSPAADATGRNTDLEVRADFDFLDQLERTVVAILQRLRGVAPAAIEDRVGGGDARSRRGVFRTHDAAKDFDRRLGMASYGLAQASKFEWFRTTTIDDARGKVWRLDVRAAVRFRDFLENKKPAAKFLRHGLHDFCDVATMPVVCPTCQILWSVANSTNR